MAQSRSNEPTDEQVDAWLAKHPPLPDGSVVCHMCGQRSPAAEAVAVVGLGWLCTRCHVRMGG
jgi:hypothetical protein